MFKPTGWKPSEHFRHFYICSLGWGGVGWGNNVHVLAHSHDVTPRHVHLHVRTYVMLRWRCVTSRRGGVGWGGNNVHVLAHSHDVTPRHVHLHVRTYVMLRWRCVTSRRGGVGWGNNVGVLAHSHDVTPRQVHLHVRTYVMLRWRCVTSRRGGVGWGNNVHVLASVPNQLTSCPENEEKLNDLIWAASKTSIKGFSIRVHVGNLPRKQNLHARKPCESSAKGVRQGHAAKAAAKADD